MTNLHLPTPGRTAARRAGGRWLDRRVWTRVGRHLARWRTPLGSVTGAAVAAALCGALLHPQGFVACAGLVAVLTVGLAWPWLGARGLTGEVRFESARGREGEPIPAVLAVRNRLPWACWGVTARVGLGRDLAVPVVGGWKRVEERIILTADRRGEYPLGTPRLASGFPFGFRESSRPLGVPRPILVWPRTFPVGPVPDAPADQPRAGLAPSTRVGTQGDFAGVRAYRRGDPIRRIHWPQTARSGQLVVTERHAETLPVVQVVLDTDPHSHLGSGPDGSREWAIRVAASFVAGWAGRGARVEAVLGGSVVADRPGEDFRRRTLDQLARLPDDGPPLAETLTLADRSRSRGGTRVVITTDRALQGEPVPSRCPGDRWVILRAAGFVGAGAAGSCDAEVGAGVGWPVRPWIVIDGPAQVADRCRFPLAEVRLES